jgi:cytidylate kinase
VVCPNATVKIFVTASPETRAQRRALELRSRGEPSDYMKVLADILHRDRRDSNRTVAPLKPASDAMILDTTDLDVEGTFREALRVVGQKLGASEARQVRSAVP